MCYDGAKWHWLLLLMFLWLPLTIWLSQVLTAFAVSEWILSILWACEPGCDADPGSQDVSGCGNQSVAWLCLRQSCGLERYVSGRAGWIWFTSAQLCGNPSWARYCGGRVSHLWAWLYWRTWELSCLWGCEWVWSGGFALDRVDGLKLLLLLCQLHNKLLYP